MRRKPTPNPIERAGYVRQLLPARAMSVGVIPTVAALALALAGCSAPQDEGGSPIAADPTSHVVQPITTAAPSSTAGAVDPTPIPMPGEPALVVPAPVKTTTVKKRPYIGSPAPSSKPPKLSGKPLSTQPHPWTT